MSGYRIGAPGWRTLLTIVVAGIVLAGCRTYGGHGNEAATYEQIQKAHQIFQDDFARKQADLRKLEQAAAGDGILSGVAMQYAQIVRGQEAVLARQAEQIAELSADSDYRHLHRVFGAIISQRNTIRTQYDGLLASLAQSEAGLDTTDATVQVERPYALTPPYYKRVEGRLRDRSINELLAQRRSGSGSAANAGRVAPDSADDHEGP